jgi:hypothetical protein
MIRGYILVNIVRMYLVANLLCLPQANKRQTLSARVLQHCLCQSLNFSSLYKEYLEFY